MNDEVDGDLVELTVDSRALRRLAPRAALVLPQLIVDAGPVAVEKFLEFFAARIANRRHARGLRAGRGAVFGVVRGAGPGAHGGRAAARGRLHPDPPRVGAHRQAAPGRPPHARRLARRQPGPAGEPGGGRPGPHARGDDGRDAGARASRGAPAPRGDRHRARSPAGATGRSSR